MKPNLQHAIERVERPGGSHERVGRKKKITALGPSSLESILDSFSVTGRDVLGDRCRMWTVGCVPTVQLHGVVLLDVVGKLSGELWIVLGLVVEVLVVERSLEEDRGRDERRDRRGERRRRGLRGMEIGRLSYLRDEEW